MQTTASAAAKHHIGPIKTLKAYVSACVSKEIIVSNEITGSEKQVHVRVFILSKDTLYQSRV